MNTDALSASSAPAPDKRSRRRRVLVTMGFVCGMLLSITGKFLPGYHGPWGIRLAVMLAPWVLVGVLVVFSRRLYQADELELLINRQALAFAFYVALIGLLALHQLQLAGLVPQFVWTAKQLVLGLVLLMAAGILWSKRRYR